MEKEKEKELLEGVQKIKTTIIEAEGKKVLINQVSLISGTFFVALTMVFFGYTMQKLTLTSTYVLFSPKIIKIIYLISMVLFSLTVIFVANFYRKKNELKSKNF